MLGVEDAVLFLALVQLGEAFADKGGVDGAIDDRVGDMDALRTQLAGHALGQGAQGELGAGEGGKIGPATQGGAGAGEDDAAASAWQHDLGRLAASQEAGQGGHLPDLAIDPLGGFGDGKLHVGADIEHHRLQRADLAFDAGEQFDHLGLDPRIAAEGPRRAAFCLDGGDQRRQFVRVAAGHTGDIALAGEAFGDGAAGCVAGTHHQDCFAFSHCASPLVLFRNLAQ
ncbi:hypothetical protein D3C85_866400 [compost metagenome]